MPGTSVPIKPGAPTQLSGAPIDANTILYNNDANNAVWVSSSQAVSPGNGMLLAPFATMNWVKTQQAWACVDTGVVASVLITMTTDVAQVDNPKALAIAVASALLAQGIPSVGVNTIIGNGTGLAGKSFTVTPYASLVLFMQSFAFAEIATTYQQFIQGALSDQAVLASQRGFISYDIPVVGDTISFLALAGSDTIVYTLVGTNRQIPSLKMLDASNARFMVVANASYPAGSQQQFVGTDSGSSEVRINGSAEIDVNFSAAGSLIMQYQDKSNVLRQVAYSLPVGASKFNIAMPNTGVFFYFQPAATATQFAVLDIIPVATV